MSVSQVDQLAAWAARATATSGGSSAPAALVSEPAAGRTVAVASGKGGVGKTTIAVNLAWLIARQGPRVLFIDADFGCANAQCYWPAVQGAPERTLGDVFAGRCSVADVVQPADPAVSTLAWIPGAPSAPEWAAIAPADREALTRDVTALATRFDWIVWDLGAGVQPDLVQLASAADGVLIVTQAEQPAIYDAYGLMKALHAGSYRGDQWLVCNRVPSLEYGRVALDQMTHVAAQALQETWVSLGCLRQDPWVGRALQQHRLVAAGDSPMAQDLAQCQRHLTGAPPVVSPRGLRGLWAALTQRR